MKLNSVEVRDDEELLEISNIYTLIRLKYNGVYDKKTAYDIAYLLHFNGIRSNMFFDEKIGIDEIVNHLAYKNKIKKFCRKKEVNYNSDVLEEGNANKGEIINFNNYYSRKSVRK